MKEHNISKTAVAKAAGTHDTSTLNSAVAAWQRHWSEPDDYPAYCQLAEATSTYLAERFPSGTLGAPLKGREKDAQEDALLLLLNRYLHGNPKLVAATACGSSSEISTQFARVTAGAWKTVVRELEKELRRNRADGNESEYLAAVDDLAERSPHLVQTFWELPVEMQLQLVFAGLRVAAHEHRLTRKTTDMVTVLLTEEGLTPSKLARRIGVTPPSSPSAPQKGRRLPQKASGRPGIRRLGLMTRSSWYPKNPGSTPAEAPLATLPSSKPMTANYYIKTYCLSKNDSEAFRVLIQDEDHPVSEDVIATFTERWHSEIRPRCNDEVECRAVMFRTLLETVCNIRRPPKTTPMLAVAWAHMITDAIHQAVAAYRPQASRNSFRESTDGIMTHEQRSPSAEEALAHKPTQHPEIMTDTTSTIEITNTEPSIPQSPPHTDSRKLADNEKWMLGDLFRCSAILHDDALDEVEKLVRDRRGNHPLATVCRRADGIIDTNGSYVTTGLELEILDACNEPLEGERTLEQKWGIDGVTLIKKLRRMTFTERALLLVGIRLAYEQEQTQTGRFEEVLRTLPV